MRKTKKICDHCGEVIKKTEYQFSITSPLKFDSYCACSEECFKNLLHKNGIATYPAWDKKSMKISRVSLAASIIALTTIIIRIILTLL